MADAHAVARHAPVAHREQKNFGLVLGCRSSRFSFRFPPRAIWLVARWGLTPARRATSRVSWSLVVAGLPDPFLPYRSICPAFRPKYCRICCSIRARVQIQPVAPLNIAAHKRQRSGPSLRLFSKAYQKPPFLPFYEGKGESLCFS